MVAIQDPASFPFVSALQARWSGVLTELCALPPASFATSPDSLTTVADGYDETGWSWFGIFGGGAGEEANRAQCPLTAAACAAVPGMINAGFSRFRPGTHLYPHRGEMAGVLRCHLPLLVPEGDVGMRFGTEACRWQPGRCLVFDDTVEHEAWNHGADDRVVLLITFAAPPR